MSLRRAAVLALALAVGAGALVGSSLLLAEREGTGTTTASDTRAVAGSPMPALEGDDLVTGRRIGVGRFRGKPVLVSVWASWCADCAQEAAALREFAERHRGKVGVLGLDVADRRADALRFAREHGWQHPSIFDPRERLAAQLGLETLPTTLVLDREHDVVRRIEGPATLPQLERALTIARRG